MDILTKEALKTLMEKNNGTFVSIFMATHRAGRETQQDPIRLKNLLTNAEETLINNNVRAPEVRALLEPAQALVEDNRFWQHQSDGLALFLTSDSSYSYRLPLNFEEMVVVADRFHLKPLLPLLSGDGQFYILALSQNEVRLLQGTRHTVDEIELEGVPESLAEALRFDDPEKQQQFHTRTSNPRGDRAAIFHGHGVGTDEEKTNILRYFQKVDKGLQDLLRDEQAPLILAGVEYLFPIYQEANSYPHLIDEGVPGNPEELRAEELHAQAWDIIQPYFQQAQQEAVTQYEALANTGQASKDIREIIPAAYYARVETLFVAVGTQKWGTFEPDTNTLNLHDEAEAGDGDLLDAAAIQTLLNGGSVYAMKPDQMPEEAPLAAIFRYSK